MYVRMYACMYVSGEDKREPRGCMYACVHVCMYVCLSPAELIGNFARLTGLYVCMYVCMYVSCMYVCMYVCMCHVCMYVQTWTTHVRVLHKGTHVNNIIPTQTSYIRNPDVCEYMYIYIYIHTYIHTYRYIHIYI
jgi:hypothetical protein